jgi:outer membrane protein assembly factor BamB
MNIRIAILILTMTGFPALGAGENWPQFRGEGARGVSDDSALPDSWSTTQNVRWKIDVPGHGWSSPVVWGDKIFVTSVISEGAVEEPKKGLYFGGNRTDIPSSIHHWMVYCIDWETGDILWERQAYQGQPKESLHLKNTYASETPVTDGKRVYVYFGNLGVFSYDMKGELAWSRFWEPVKTRYGWGLAASPVLHEDRLIIVNDNEDQSFITALDKQTGEEVWRVDRDEGSNWATPLVWNNDLRTEVVTPGTDRVRSYGLDGTLLWEFRGMSSITIPTPFSDSGLVFISSGYVGDELRPAYAVRLGASGDISLQENETSNEYIAWSLRQAGPYNPSPLVYGEYYYTLLDRGFMTCHKARTGELVYSKRRIERGSGAFTASPWAYDGKIFCLSEDGDTFVIKAGPEFELLGKNSLDEMSMATPALSQGSLIIRTASKLYRIARPPKSTVEHGTD